MGKTYRTAQGKQLDIEKLRLQNELTLAVGNMRVNARGDQLGPGGKIVKNREQMLDDHYKSNVSRRGNAPDDIPTKGGKSKKVETFEPGKIEVDNVAPPKNDLPLEDEFVDPTVGESLPETDPTTGIAAGEKELKGGLARAVAKTKAYESTKNKPKRL